MNRYAACQIINIVKKILHASRRLTSQDGGKIYVHIYHQAYRIMRSINKNYFGGLMTLQLLNMKPLARATSPTNQENT
jgi:hypothetical protein